MIGIVLVTHGRLAVEFRAALEHVVGVQTQCETIIIDPDDDMEQRRQDIVKAVAAVNSGRGVAILTDMFGGTPSNLAMTNNEFVMLGGNGTGAYLNTAASTQVSAIGNTFALTGSGGAGLRATAVAAEASMPSRTGISIPWWVVLVATFSPG